MPGKKLIELLSKEGLQVVWLLCTFAGGGRGDDFFHKVQDIVCFIIKILQREYITTRFSIIQSRGPQDVLCQDNILKIDGFTISHSFVKRMQDQQNLKKLRDINNNKYVEIQHESSELEHSKESHHDHSTHQHGKKHEHQHGHSHGHEHNHDDEQEGHEGHNHKKGHHSKKTPGQKNYVIIIYTIFTCLSCLYLETQYLNPLIGDSKAHLMTYLTYFDVFMCLWSYFQTMRINSHVSKLQQKSIRPYNLDYKRRCEKCDYWKGPRISHCSTCGKCIYKLDHHCMWTQTCIGHCNQRPFYLFCFYMTVGVFQFWYSTVRALSLMNANCNILGVFEPGVYILWIITCFSAGLVGIMIVGLCVGHSFFISTNFTTLQSMKARRPFSFPFLQFRASYLAPDAINEWDRGQIQNLKSVFGDNILTFWMPIGRQIVNEYIFEPMNPFVEMPSQRGRVNQNEVELKGKKVKINDKIVEL